MSQISTNRQFAYIPEATYGITPATPQMVLFEAAQFDLNPTAEILRGTNIRPDQTIAFARRGNRSGEGTIEVGLTPDNYDVFLEAQLGGTWATNLLTNGTTARSFTFEEQLLGISRNIVYTGTYFNAMSMELTAEGLVNASFNVMFNTATESGTVLDTTPTAIVAKDQFFHEGGTFNEGGSAFAAFQSISFEHTRNAVGNRALGNSGFRSISGINHTVTGTVTALFESNALYLKALNGTESSLSFTLVAGAESLQFSFPRVVYSAPRLVRDLGGPLVVELPFEAVRDGVTGSVIRINRV